MQISKLNRDKKKEIIEKYNSSSFFYDSRYKKIQQEKMKIAISEIHLKSMILLDVGCGSGLFFEFLVNKSKSYHNLWINYLGIDISLNMLKLFIKKCKNKKTSIITNLILADIENLPLRNSKCDFIISITSFQNLPNINKGGEELLRVGKHKAGLRFSILRKNIELDSFISSLNEGVKNLGIIDNYNIEDVIIQGTISK